MNESRSDVAFRELGELLERYPDVFGLCLHDRLEDLPDDHPPGGCGQPDDAFRLTEWIVVTTWTDLTSDAQDARTVGTIQPGMLRTHALGLAMDAVSEWRSG